MSGRPNAAAIPWDADSLSILRQVVRVAMDDKFRSGEREGVSPSAIEIARKFNVYSDDDWETFVFDLPVGKRTMKDVKLHSHYACYLISFLVERLELPIRPEWHRKSFIQRWERAITTPGSKP